MASLHRSARLCVLRQGFSRPRFPILHNGNLLAFLVSGGSEMVCKAPDIQARFSFLFASVFPGPRKGLEHSRCLIHVCQRNESEGLQNGKRKVEYISMVTVRALPSLHLTQEKPKSSDFISCRLLVMPGRGNCPEGLLPQLLPAPDPAVSGGGSLSNQGGEASSSPGTTRQGNQVQLLRLYRTQGAHSRYTYSFLTFSQQTN